LRRPFVSAVTWRALELPGKALLVMAVLRTRHNSPTDRTPTVATQK